ncbi:MAG: cell division protein FtsZ [Opitutales bacterium]
MDGGKLKFEKTTEMAASSETALTLKIVGVGGGGTNTVDRLRLESAGRAHLAAVNTDAQALAQSPISEKVLVGRKLTRGLSTGGESSLGQAAAEADEAHLRALVKGCDLVFVVAGLGGGTGSGAAPVLARVAREQDAMVLAFVTLPFAVEGARRMKQAEQALVELRESCDAVIPLPNDLLLQQVEEEASVLDAFQRADEWIACGIHSICDLLLRTGLINLDFAALRRAFERQGGKTLFGIGRAEGPEAARKAVEKLLMCPLLHTTNMARRADSLLVNITGGTDLSLQQVNQIVAQVSERFASREQCVLGAVIEDSWRERVEICLIGTTELDPGRTRIPVRRPAWPPTHKVEPPATAKEQPSVMLTEPVPDPVDVPFDLDGSAPASKRSNLKVHASKLSRRKATPTDSQEEFIFASEKEQRGYFDHTERNLFEGADLDVPTYLRRGIRIQV